MIEIGNWSSPAYAEIKGEPAIIFAAGDGFCYAFDPQAKEDDEGFLVFPEIWKFDCNAPEYRKDENGEPIKYATFRGPSEIIGTTVIHVRFRQVNAMTPAERRRGQVAHTLSRVVKKITGN